MDDWGPKPWAVFADKAIQLKRAMGAALFPIINRDKHPQEWRDWYAYYGARKMLASQDLMRAKPDKTVPTISPFDFDASFNPSRAAPLVPDDRMDTQVHVTTEERARHARLYPALFGNSQFVPMPNEPREDIT